MSGRDAARRNTMTQLIVDADLLRKLRNLTEPLELIDEAGRPLGRVLPAVGPERFEGLEPRITREEMERRKQNKGKTYTTAEVLKYLENL
jgi:hypothetical protein